MVINSFQVVFEGLSISYVFYIYAAGSLGGPSFILNFVIYDYLHLTLSFS